MEPSRVFRNPELESLRDTVLCGNSADSKGNAIRLASAINRIHASYLFHPEGRPALKALCLSISATPQTTTHATWKDLAASLKLSYQEIGCISNVLQEDMTAVTLMTFAQYKDATLAEVVRVLSELGRYDTIQQITAPLTVLADFVSSSGLIIRGVENGYNSLTSSRDGEHEAGSDGVIRPRDYQQLRYQLPLSLRHLNDKVVLLQDEYTAIQHESYQNSSPLPTTQEYKNPVVYSKRVMLTFAEDGREAAWDIARQLRKKRGNHHPIGVLILDDHEEKVSRNIEQSITSFFPRMDYIIPVITDGYIKALSTKQSADHSGSAMSCIDARYVQFIHDLMTKYYVENQCRNEKIRCVIPDEDVNRLLEHRIIKNDPTLKVWLKKSQIEILACRMLKIKYKPSS